MLNNEAFHQNLNHDELASHLAHAVNFLQDNEHMKSDQAYFQKFHKRKFQPLKNHNLPIKRADNIEHLVIEKLKNRCRYAEEATKPHLYLRDCRSDLEKEI